MLLAIDRYTSLPAILIQLNSAAKNVFHSHWIAINLHIKWSNECLFACNLNSISFKSKRNRKHFAVFCYLAFIGVALSKPQAQTNWISFIKKIIKTNGKKLPAWYERFIIDEIETFVWNCDYMTLPHLFFYVPLPAHTLCHSTQLISLRIVIFNLLQPHFYFLCVNIIWSFAVLHFAVFLFNLYN